MSEGPTTSRRRAIESELPRLAPQIASPKQVEEERECTEPMPGNGPTPGRMLRGGRISRGDGAMSPHESGGITLAGRCVRPLAAGQREIHVRNLEIPQGCLL